MVLLTTTFVSEIYVCKECLHYGSTRNILWGVLTGPNVIHRQQFVEAEEKERVSLNCSVNQIEQIINCWANAHTQLLSKNNSPTVRISVITTSTLHGQVKEKNKNTFKFCPWIIAHKPHQHSAQCQSHSRLQAAPEINKVNQTLSCSFIIYSPNSSSRSDHVNITIYQKSYWLKDTLFHTRPPSN